VRCIAISNYENLTWDELQPSFDLSYSVWDEEEKSAFSRKKIWLITGYMKVVIHVINL
jgi:hypothetical protein